MRRGEWQPTALHKDPTVNAILNVACSLSEVADALTELLYGLKYSRNGGLSIAEAIEVGAGKIADAVGDVANATRSEE